MAKITLTHKCPFCGTERQKEFDEEQYRKYKAGAFVQDAMPDSSPDDREFLITGICPDCWDNTFGGGETDMKTRKHLKRLVTIRANRIPAWDIAFILDNDDFRVAGGCFMDGLPNDYDVYPAFGKSFNADRIRKNTIESLKGEVICETKNAITVKVHGKVIQFCHYYKATLQELVDSFDFSHCQVGVEFSSRETKDGGIAMPKIKDIAWFDAWVEYRITRQSTYTGSEYPLSSLIRLNKYVKRDIIKGKSYTIEVLKILNDIIKRGYTDYQDFKKQLDAVDLLLLEPKEANAAYELFKTCHTARLVRTQYQQEELDNGLLDVLEETDNGLR